jgi:hypothetical protein
MVDAPMDPIDPDTLLMLAFQNGDSGAFEQLLGKYHNLIVNFIYKIVNNSAEAEELATAMAASSISLGQSSHRSHKRPSMSYNA